MPGQAQEFDARRFISWGSEKDDSAAQLWLAGCTVRPLPVMAAGPCGGRGPIRVPDSGYDTLLRGGAPPCTSESIKDGSRGLLGSCLSCSSSQSEIDLHPLAADSALLHRLAADSAFFTALSLAPPTHLILSATLPTCSRLCLLHPLAAGSTQPPSPPIRLLLALRPLALDSTFSTHSPLAPPKVPPSHLMVVPLLLIAKQGMTREL